jgi:predicted AlkP superfamily pyrophosphatase or phosphodiesterase
MSVSRRLVSVALLLASAAFAPQAVLPRVVLISIDGLSPAAYTSRDGAKVPHLRALALTGAHGSVRGVVPTVTYPSHTTLITGVPPAVHGIVDNAIVDPEGRADGAWHWYAEGITVPTLPQAASDRGHVGAVSWPVTVGMDIAYNVPDFWRSDHIESLSLLKGLSRPHGIIDMVAEARGTPMPWPLTDRERTDIAKHILRTKPVLLMVHFIDHDFAQHDYGPGSPAALATLEQIDRYVGEIEGAIDEAGVRAATTIAVVSDHGFLPTRTQLQPNALFRQEGLLTTGSTGRVTKWQAYFHAAGGSGFVYLDPAGGVALRDRVARLLDQLAADNANGIERIWTREDLDRLGAHPGAAFGIAMAPGFYSTIGSDVLLKPTRGRGGHGFDPAHAEMNGALILNGNGIGRRGDLGVVRMTQIAPTLARLLRVSLAPAADTPLWGVDR